MKLKIVLKGGPGSGHTGHAGRPGKQGGSLPGKGTGAGWSSGRNNAKGKKYLHNGDMIGEVYASGAFNWGGRVKFTKYGEFEHVPGSPNFPSEEAAKTAVQTEMDNYESPFPDTIKSKLSDSGWKAQSESEHRSPTDTSYVLYGKNRYVMAFPDKGQIWASYIAHGEVLQMDKFYKFSSIDQLLADAAAYVKPRGKLPGK